MPVVFYLSSPQCGNVATKLQANRLSIVNVVDVFPHQCRWTFGSYTNCHHQHQQQQQQQQHREVFVVLLSTLVCKRRLALAS
ncbi:Phospholipase A1-IIalpha [Trichinella spiralis]|uniref:Phospholipase A1-IIalpha n=1 Tax=Trichinella spiralis TaxID=6334 RepID=A0ABR3KF77_TRISP